MTAIIIIYVVLAVLLAFAGERMGEYHAKAYLRHKESERMVEESRRAIEESRK